MNVCDETLLLFNAKEHKEDEVEHLLKIGYDSKVCDVEGNTPLMLAVSKTFSIIPKYDIIRNCATLPMIFIRKSINYAELKKKHNTSCMKIMDMLILHGTDVHVCNVKGENVLHVAAKNWCCFDILLLKKLVSAGVNPTLKTKENRTLQSYAMEKFIDICTKFEGQDEKTTTDIYLALKYLLNLNNFETDSCDVKFHPETMLLKNIHYCQTFKGNEAILPSLMVTNQKLLNPNMVVKDMLHVSSYYIKETDLQFGPLAMCLNYNELYCMSYKIESYFDIMVENIKFLASIGFRATVQAQETVSPLTIVFMHASSEIHYVPLVKSLLKIGAHVEQRFLTFEEMDPELEQLSAELLLPDVLRVILSYKPQLSSTITLELVKLFLPHFAHPGLTLLPFTTPEKVSILFPYLASCGALEHTALHRNVMKKILKSGCLSKEQLHTFNQIHSSIPRLQSLCRTAARVHLAPQATHHGNSLLEVIHSCPPILIGNFFVNIAEFME